MIDINLNLPIDTTPTNGSTNLIDSNAVFDGLALKVDKVTGKQLSTEDYTTTEKSKLAGIAAGAEVNVNADFNAVSGDAQILNKPTYATYISDTITDGEITKAPTQNAVFDALALKQATLVSATNIKTINGNTLLGSGDLVVGASSGIFGISNSSGIYTYYSTLTLAMAAATSGQTIEMFTSVTETGAVQINLKNGVNINFNGHTYTLNNAGTQNALSDNNVAVTCKLMNGKVVRSGGTNSESNSCALYLDNSSSILECTGMKFESTFGHGCINEGTMYGGEYFGAIGFYARTGIAYNVIGSSNTSIGFRVFSSRCVNCTGISSASHGISINGGTLENCHGVSTGGGGYGGFFQGGVALNCTFFASSSFGVGAISGDNSFLNCSFRSSSNVGIYAQTKADLDNCTGYSTASHALWLNTGASMVKNSTGYSTINNGIRVASSVELHNCTAHSIAAAALYSEGKIYNCNAICSWNNANGHAITGAITPFTEVFNCNLQVINASANCLHYGSAINVKFGSNVFKGATTDVNANITQTQANAPDTYGNIKIG